MFGDVILNDRNWETDYLGNVCDMKAGKMINASELEKEFAPNLFPCYGGNGLRGYINKYNNEGSYPLIGRQGALCGNVQLSYGKFYATEHAVVTKPIKENQLNTTWLTETLCLMDLNRLATGVAQPGLSVKNLASELIILPPIELQNQFADFVKHIDKLKFRKNITKLKNICYNIFNFEKFNMQREVKNG